MTKKSPLELPGLLVTDEILEGILEQTNLFTEQFIESHELPCHSQVQQWRRSSPHDVDELRKFLALTVVMGLVSFPSIKDAWVKTWPFATFTFSSIMT